MTKTRSAAIAALVMLVGCAASPEYLAAQRSRQQAQEESYLNYLAGRCLSEGFRQADGPMFETCVRRQHAECERAKSSAQSEFYTGLLANNKPGSRFNQNAATAASNVNTSRLCPPRS